MNNFANPRRLLPLYKKRLTRTGSSGDTIVEVLISIVIISLVLGAAFTLSNRSNKSSIGSRERVEALKFVEGQLEILKTKRSIPGFATIYQDPTKDYCFDAAGVQVLTSPSTCTVGDAAYKLNIKYTDTGNPATSYFNLSATWDNFNNDIPNVVNLAYRP